MGKEKQRSLGKMLSFTVDDLRHNHEGILSESQRRRLRVRQFWHEDVFAGVGWAVMCLLVMATMVSSLLKELSRPFDWDILLTVWLVVFTGFVAWLGAWLAWKHAIGVYRDLREGKVVRISGKVAHRHNRYRYAVFYYIVIANQWFEVTQKQRAQFVPDKPYHVYVLPNSRLVLSAEPIPAHEAEAMLERVTSQT